MTGKFVLNRNLREQKPALQTLRNQQTVFPDFDVLGKNWLERRQQGDFDSQPSKFFQTDGREPRIAQSRTGRAPRDGFCQWLDGLDDAEARLPDAPVMVQEACRQGGIVTAAFSANPTTGQLTAKCGHVPRRCEPSLCPRQMRVPPRRYLGRSLLEIRPSYYGSARRQFFAIFQ